MSFSNSPKKKKRKAWCFLS